MLLSIDKTGYLLTSITWPYHGLRCRPIEVEYLFEVISWQVTSFQMMAGSSLIFLIHMKYVVFYMCRTIKILLSNSPRKLKFSQCLQAGKTCRLLLTFLTKVTRWSRSTSNFYALIGQNLTGEFMRKIYAACVLKLVYFDSWSWQRFVSTCDVFNCLFPLSVQSQTQLLSRVFCYSWLVCLLSLWLRNTSLVKVGNPISILALLDKFQCISNYCIN